ncbi:MAG TPA: AraC family transcriptional regulator [Chitinophagaceae bacterium]|nr:AraC family transcriptional regulator [Chitinophagaceae bacterium]
MKLLQTVATNQTHTHIALVNRDEQYFQSPFHHHPEFELVFIKEGYGQRIIGDKMEFFSAGDMVFLGSNVPHLWRNDDVFYNNFNSSLRAKSLVLYFNKDIFSTSFYQQQEAFKINNFFSQAKRGIKIKGKTMEKVAERMEKLVNTNGFEKVIGTMEILHILSISREIEYIANEVYGNTVVQARPDRLTEVYTYISGNFHQDITLESIARIANLTPPAFCRLFKQQTKKHFIEYLNEIRIANACKYLLQSNLNISEIAFECGYKTISNFNKIFKKITSFSPKEYRVKATSDA